MTKFIKFNNNDKDLELILNNPVVRFVLILIIFIVTLKNLNNVFYWLFVSSVLVTKLIQKRVSNNLKWLFLVPLSLIVIPTTLIILISTWMLGNDQQPQVTSIPTSQPQLNNVNKTTVEQVSVTPSKIKTAVISGIEQDLDSEAYGELVVSEVNVWENPGPNRGSVVGKVMHNQQVEILEQKTTDQLYYQIKATNGKNGWISHLFIQ